MTTKTQTETQTQPKANKAQPEGQASSGEQSTATEAAAIEATATKAGATEAPSAQRQPPETPEESLLAALPASEILGAQVQNQAGENVAEVVDLGGASPAGMVWRVASACCASAPPTPPSER